MNLRKNINALYRSRRTVYGRKNKIDSTAKKLKILLKALEMERKFGSDIFKLVEDMGFSGLNEFIDVYRQVDMRGIYNYYVRRAGDSKREVLESFLFPYGDKQKITKELVYKLDMKRLGRRQIEKLVKILQVAYAIPRKFIMHLKSSDAKTVNELYAEMNYEGKEVIEDMLSYDEYVRKYATMVFEKRPYIEALQFLDRPYYNLFKKVMKTEKSLGRFNVEVGDIIIEFVPEIHVQMAAKDMIKSCVSLLGEYSYSMLNEMAKPEQAFCVIRKRGRIIGRFRVFKDREYFGRISNVYTLPGYEIPEEDVELAVEAYATAFNLDYIPKERFSYITVKERLVPY